MRVIYKYLLIAIENEYPKISLVWYNDQRNYHSLFAFTLKMDILLDYSIK